MTQFAALLELGGPVIAILLALSILSLAMILYKLWQFWTLGVGRHARIDSALRAWDAGQTQAAHADLAQSRNHLSNVLADAMHATPEMKSRLIAMAEDRLSHMTRGFRLLDAIAQISPLLGLFGTVLGMIDAFRALQAAGSAVDPSVLAGGIWVALLTTAAGLAVAMPTSLALTFFESRAARDRAKADLALETFLHPLPTPADRSAQERIHVAE